MSNLVYEPYTIEDAEIDQKENQKKSNFHKLKAGANKLRIVPAKPGGKPFLTFHNHFVESVQKGFACPRMMASEHCPICAIGEQLASSSNAADRRVAWKQKPKLRTMMNVILRGKDVDDNAGVVVLGVGPQIFEQLTAIRLDEEFGADFIHPEKGHDLNIHRTGTGQNDTVYMVRMATVSSPLAASVDEMNKLIMAQPDLAPLAIPPDAERLAELLDGTAAPASTSAQRKPANRQLPHAEDDDFDVDAEFLDDPGIDDGELVSGF